MANDLSHSKSETINAVEFQTDNKEPLQIGKEKWKIWHDVLMKIADKKLEPEIRRYQRLAAMFRVAIIALAATATIASSLADDNQKFRYVGTVLSAVITALAGIEAHFQFTERYVERKQQQRELQGLRYDLSSDWIISVEMETDPQEKLNAAKRIIQRTKNEFNNVQNKYTRNSRKDTNSGA